MLWRRASLLALFIAAGGVFGQVPEAPASSVEQLVQQAFERNREILAARQRVEEARGLLRQAGVRPVPTVEVNAGTQLHPYFAGSNPTWLSTVWNFQRQNQAASRPFALSNQWIADPRPAVAHPTYMRVIVAGAVTQQPAGSSPANAGQLPSRFWSNCRLSMARSSSEPLWRRRAKITRHIDSVVHWLGCHSAAPDRSLRPTSLS